MGRNGSYNQIHHHRNLSTSSTTTTNSNSTSFLPLLCRFSTKDVVEISPCHKINDPSSPKVSCMGQIKRHNNNNKINPTSTTTGKIRYTQLKKIFSGRNLLIITTNTSSSTIACTRTSTYCKPNNNNNKVINKKVQGGEYHKRTRSDNCGVVVPLNLAELDPPLPVVKLTCHRRGEEEGGSLWKRRGGGTPLGGLQIQPIQLPIKNSCLLITPPSVS